MSGFFRFLGLKSEAPAPPPPPPAPPTRENSREVAEAAAEERKRRRIAQGRGSTILTSGLGTLDTGTSKKTLLGG